jgi:hypothetical protein
MHLSLTIRRFGSCIGIGTFGVACSVPVRFKCFDSVVLQREQKELLIMASGCRFVPRSADRWKASLICTIFA